MLVFAADMHDTFQTLYALRFRDGLQGNGYRWVPQQTAGNAPASRTRLRSGTERHSLSAPERGCRHTCLATLAARDGAGTYLKDCYYDIHIHIIFFPQP